MDFLIALSGAQWGTAQDLTFGILFGAFNAVVILSLFWARTGHERAHRTQELRRFRREELGHERPETLERLERPPRRGEELPR